MVRDTTLSSRIADIIIIIILLIGALSCILPYLVHFMCFFK